MKIDAFTLKAISKDKIHSYELVHYHVDRIDNEEYYVMTYNHNNTRIYMDFELYEDENFEIKMLEDLTQSTTQVFDYISASKDTTKKLDYLITTAYKYYTHLQGEDAYVIVDSIKMQLRQFAAQLIRENPRNFSKVYTNFTDKEKIEQYFKILYDNA